MRTRIIALCAALGAGSLACQIGIGNFAGKSCDIAADCPDPYVCVSARPGAGRTCELLRAPLIGQFDDGGPPAYYCDDIKPILEKSCISNCHGIDQTNGPPRGPDGGFALRLDYYDRPGDIPGAKIQAERIAFRSNDDTMPPRSTLGTIPRTTIDDRRAIGRWIRSGLTFASDGGTSCGSDGGI